jgi:hypothetical protein
MYSFISLLYMFRVTGLHSNKGGNKPPKPWNGQKVQITQTVTFFKSSTDYGEVFYIVTVHLGTILVNNQLDALFNVFVYFAPLHVSSNPVLIIRRINLSIHHPVCITLCR